MDLNTYKNIKEINIAFFWEVRKFHKLQFTEILDCPVCLGINYISQWHHLLGDEQDSEAHWASLTAPFHS